MGLLQETRERVEAAVRMTDRFEGLFCLFFLLGKFNIALIHETTVD
jgi:hypothetical protein